MKGLLEIVMTANAVLFFFGAVQHAGFAMARFHEPRIIPAAIVETLCGVALAWGVIALAKEARTARRLAVIANLIALFGVIVGMVALALGAGPRTASNDLYHKMMLVMIAAALLIIAFSRRLGHNVLTSRQNELGER
jgi:peptidoglycan/LPS O-acetylase OafA/YrhL